MFDGRGRTADRAWSALTFDVSAALDRLTVAGRYGEQATVEIAHDRPKPYDCLALAATVFGTAVDDSDGDGLLDIMEDPSPFGVDTLLDPNGQPYPKLNAMGAVVGQKDTVHRSDGDEDHWTAVIRVAIGSVQSGEGPGHCHGAATQSYAASRSAEAGRRRAFDRAGIHAHFDVGPPSAYRNAANGADTIADTYLIGSGAGGDSGDESLARGGEEITEHACDPAVEPWCEFPEFAGTVSWKLQYQQLRDAWVSDSGAELDADGLVACASRGPLDPPCRRRLIPVRNNVFRTVLFAHARGEARSPFPCLPSGVASPTVAQLLAASTLSPRLAHARAAMSRIPSFTRRSASQASPIFPARAC